MRHIRTLLEMFFAFFKIGAFTFGGGYAMIPLIQREVVDAKGWATNEEFLDMLGLAQTAPGPVAVNTSVFVGYRTAGIPGAVAAVAGTTLPSFLVILVIAMFSRQLRNSAQAEAAFSGVRPAVVALVAGAAYRIGRSAIRDMRGVAVGIAAFVAIVGFRVHPVPVIVGSAALGYLLFGRELAGGPRGSGPTTQPAGKQENTPDAPGEDQAVSDT